MNNKASAQCRNGHSFEFGACGAPVKKLFGGTRGCGCRRFEQVYADGRTSIVSFDSSPFDTVLCLDCKAQHTSRKCPTCGDMVPMTAFRKTGLWAKLS